jgi:thioredoxin reductase (NADPH)
MFPHLSKVLTI